MQPKKPDEKVANEKPVAARPPLLLIHWFDAHHEFGWLEGNEDPEPVEIPLVYSIGWLISQNQQGIRICQSWTVDNHAQTLTIPARMIEKILQIDPSVVENQTLTNTSDTAKRTTKRTKQPT